MQNDACQHCEGKGKLCATCHQPLDACECPGEDQPEDCLNCGGTGRDIDKQFDIAMQDMPEDFRKELEKYISQEDIDQAVAAYRAAYRARKRARRTPPPLMNPGDTRFL